jgi:hypothetical protein
MSIYDYLSVRRYVEYHSWKWESLLLTSYEGYRWYTHSVDNGMAEMRLTIY